MEVVLPLLLFGLLGALVVRLAGRTVSAPSRQRVVQLLLIALVLRIAAATMFALFPSTRIFHDDATGYEWVGERIATYWRGEGPPLDMRDGRDQNYGYFYVCGGLYYVFGRFPAVVSYVNCILGTLVVLFVYRLAATFFDRRVAYRAALLAALVPSMILWSAMALKDTLTTLLILICLSGCIALRKRFTLASLSMMLLPVLAIQPVRFYMIYFLLFAITVSLLLDRGLGSVTGIWKPIIVGVVFVALLSFAGLSSSVQAGMQVIDLQTVSTFRHGMATTANSGFAQDVDISSPGAAIAFMPLGVATLLLSPFPWQLTSLRAAFALPEMIVWWSLIPALVRGLLFAVRYRWREVLPLLAFGITLTLAYSLVHGNVGSGFRQRAQIFVILFIFTSLGWYQKKCRRARVDERMLLLPTRTATSSAA